MSLFKTTPTRCIVLGLLVTILYFQHSKAVSLSIIPGAQTTLNNGTIPQAEDSSKIEFGNEKDLTKQGLQCYALRCYGHFVNIHRCCPNFHCSFHIPLVGGICIRDPEIIPHQNEPEIIPYQTEPEKQTSTIVQGPGGEVASEYPSFEEIPPKEASSPQPTTATIPINNQLGFIPIPIPTIPSYADLAVFP